MGRLKMRTEFLTISTLKACHPLRQSEIKLIACTLGVGAVSGPITCLSAGASARIVSASSRRFDERGEMFPVDVAALDGGANSATRLGVVQTIPEPTLQC